MPRRQTRLDHGLLADGFYQMTGQRLDANETAIFARALEHVQVQTYDILYPELKALLLAPIIGGVDPGAEWFDWRGFQRYGAATRITNYADDSPRVDVNGSEERTKIEHYGDSYAYSVQDLRRISMASVGMPLDQRRALAAREILARKLDKIVAFGDPTVPIMSGGILNYPNVPLVTPITGGWTTATAAEILADLFYFERTIYVGSNGVEMPDTLILPPSRMGIIATTPASSINPEVTILDVFLKKAMFIRNVEDWYTLETADAALTGPRAVAYRRDPTKLGSIVPLEFNQLPPEPRNYSFVVNCEARCGGAVFFYPLSAAYMDGI